MLNQKGSLNAVTYDADLRTQTYYVLTPITMQADLSYVTGATILIYLPWQRYLQFPLIFLFISFHFK